MAHESPIPDAIPFRTLGPLSGRAKATIGAIGLLGLLAAFLGAGAVEPARIWQGLLFNWLFWSALAMGMVMFAVALHLTNADWAWSIRRFALGGAAFLPLSFLLLPVVLFGGKEHIFHHWLHVEGDPVIDAKRAWLNFPGLAARDLIGVAILYTMALAFAYLALRPDVYGVKGKFQGLYARFTRNFRGVTEEAERSHRTMMKLGVFLALAYVFLWGMVAIDLAMSLDPHFFSTMFPVIFFWTGFHGGVALTAIAVALLRTRLGLDRFITGRQFHDLGKLIFGFSVFWMYVSWSQYIVIWYGLLPHEQAFFVKRFSEPFGPVTIAAVLLVFVIPFFGLLTRPPKMVPAIVAFFATLILVGHWLERYLLIYPSLLEHGEGHAAHPALPLGLLEVGIALAFLSLFLAAYTWYLQRFPLLPSPATLKARGSAVVAVPATVHEA